MIDFISGVLIGVVIGALIMIYSFDNYKEAFADNAALIKDCETKLPRDVKCILVAQPE